MAIALRKTRPGPVPRPRRPGRLSDARGNPVTAAGPGAIARIDQFSDIILRRGRGAELILETAADNPDCPAVQAYAAAYHLLSDERSGIHRAQAYLAAAGRRLASATDREIGLVAALTAMADDRPKTAGSYFLELCREAPGDLLSAYLAHLHFLNHGRFAEMLQLARIVCAVNPSDGFALGMLSFALEEEGQLGKAEVAGLEACARDPNIPWAHHAVAHVHGALGRIDDGVAFLGQFAASWEACGSSMYTHNWWHTMLLHLARGDAATALALYDKKLAPDCRESLSSGVNAVSMLARLEIHGVDVGSRWDPLADEAELRVDEHVLAFMDLHHALALSRAGRLEALSALRHSALLHASNANCETHNIWFRAGIPLIEAVAAYGCGAWHVALERFETAMSHFRLVGGSHAQRHLLHQLATTARARCSSLQVPAALGHVVTVDSKPIALFRISAAISG